MKYSVSIELKRDFKVDIKGLIDWAKSNLSLDVEQYTDSWIQFNKEGSLTEDITGEYQSDEQKQLIEYYQSLVEVDEIVKLALPSRLVGSDLQAWEIAKKSEIAAITDFSALSDAQKKLWMGLPLTDAEKDSLGA